jgi:enoyl-CoA hydratase/carnithine racemase
MTYTTLLTDVTDGALTVTLNRPEKLNAFTLGMADELIDVFGRANADDAVRAVIVTGAGRGFCAGMDLSAGSATDQTLEPTLADMHERLDDPALQKGVRDSGGRVVLAIYDCLKPVIGAINGVAVGVGATMTLPMDVRIATPEARIGFIFGRIGLVPEACSSWFLPRIVGMSQALDWTYSAEIVPAEAARDAGLIKAVVPADRLLEEARALARRYTEHRSAVGTALTRQLMYRNAGASHPLEAHRVDSLAIFHQVRGDAREGMQAFAEKRAPQFPSRVSRDLPAFVAPWLRGETR